MNKKIIAVLMALVLIPATLAAAPVVITWEWMVDDPMVTTFRYQVDGEDPSLWTVVDATVTSYTVKGLDGSVPHTLYLQQSYDGVNFSASSLSVAEPIEPAVPEAPAVSEASVELPAEQGQMAEEAVTATAEEPAMEEAAAAEPEQTMAEEPEQTMAATEEPVEETMAAEPEQTETETADAEPGQAETEMAAEGTDTVVVATEPEQPSEETPESRYSTTISLGGGLFYVPQSIGTYGKYVPQATLGVGMNNIVSFGNNFGLGLELGVTFDPMLSNNSWGSFFGDLLTSFGPTLSTLTPVWSVSAMPKLDMSFGKFDAYLGGGGFLFYAPSGATLVSNQYMYGLFGKLSVAYRMNGWFSLGASGSYYWVFPTSEEMQMVKATMFMGFSF